MSNFSILCLSGQKKTPSGRGQKVPGSEPGWPLIYSGSEPGWPLIYSGSEPGSASYLLRVRAESASYLLRIKSIFRPGRVGSVPISSKDEFTIFVILYPNPKQFFPEHPTFDDRHLSSAYFQSKM